MSTLNWRLDNMRGSSRSVGVALDVFAGSQAGVSMRSCQCAQLVAEIYARERGGGDIGADVSRKRNDARGPTTRCRSHGRPRHQICGEEVEEQRRAQIRTSRSPVPKINPAPTTS